MNLRHHVIPEQMVLDPLSDRFKASVDEPFLKPSSDLRTPLVQKYSDSEFVTKTDFRNIPYSRVGPSPYDEVLFREVLCRLLQIFKLFFCSVTLDVLCQLLLSHVA